MFKLQCDINCAELALFRVFELPPSQSWEDTESDMLLSFGGEWEGVLLQGSGASFPSCNSDWGAVELLSNSVGMFAWGKWKTRKAGTGTETETETEIWEKIVRSKSIRLWSDCQLGGRVCWW